MTKVSVIIPAHDEAQTIGDLVSKTRAIYPDFEVIVINDGSTDDTAAVARDAGAKVFSHPYNIGNGAAVKSGIRIASSKILVFMDGDGQHDPDDIAKLLEHFPEFDMVVGARSKADHASLGRTFGNTAYNWLASYVAKFRVEDLTSGFRAVKADIAHNLLYLLPNTYSYPTTLTLSVLRNGRTVKYVPIKAKMRKSGKSGINIFKDGIRFFMIIVKICTLFSPFRIFLPVSFLTFLTGLFYYLYTFCMWGRFTNMSALLFTTSMVIFMMGIVSEQICQMRFDRSEGEK
ncbi:MAG: glycosyltransferase family 2 protein [Deltaproteobacteria bacterium]|jgi:glycosyltransferase involved in cell wall biosynthesis|nr:glycosyltransferase family 2 protein [Deltaproteobacteria bacterium]